MTKKSESKQLQISGVDRNFTEFEHIVLSDIIAKSKSERTLSRDEKTLLDYLYADLTEEEQSIFDQLLSVYADIEKLKAGITEKRRAAELVRREAAQKAKKMRIQRLIKLGTSIEKMGLLYNDVSPENVAALVGYLHQNSPDIIRSLDAHHSEWANVGRKFMNPTADNSTDNADNDADDNAEHNEN